MRTSQISRHTGETDVRVPLDLDGTGMSVIDTGIGFLDHMLTLFSHHGSFDLEVECRGDIQVDDHHSTEDIGICIGDAFAEALGDRAGINRYASAVIPMDEALVLCAVDISGRGCLRYSLDVPTEKVGTFDTQLVEEFFTAFARRSDISVHLRQLDGINSHHIIEACFKAFGRAMKQAVAIDPDMEGRIPSTKGVL